MLRKATLDELEEYMDQAYAVALDLTRSGYPTYTDGIKTREDFENAIRKGLRDETRQNLLYVEAGQTAGLIQLSCTPEDSYLMTSICNIEAHTEKALAELDAYCGANFPGYDLHFGFPKENREAARYLTEHGWTCVERSYNNVLHFRDYLPQEERGETAAVTRENFRDFQALHQPIEGDMYWNCQRLYQDLDRWNIWLAYREGVPAAAVYYLDAGILTEIFGVDFRDGQLDEAIFQDLMARALNHCKDKGCQHMVFFGDDETQKAILSAGFHCVGEYVLFHKKA